MIYIFIFTTILFFGLFIKERFFSAHKNENQEIRLNRASERIYVFWFWLVVWVILYDAILNDIVTKYIGIDVSPISDQSIELIKHGFIYFVAPIIFKILKDSAPEFIQFAEIMMNKKTEVSVDEKKYQE